MFIIAQIIGVLAIVVFAISPHQKSKVKVLVFEILSSIFFALQYFLLGAYSGTATSMITIINNLIFAKYAKDEKKIPFYWLGIYIIVNILAGIFTYTNIFSFFPVVISILYAYGVWQDNLKVNRFIILFGALAWMIYNLAVSAYSTSIGNLYEIISAAIAIWRLDIYKNKKEITNLKKE